MKGFVGVDQDFVLDPVGDRKPVEVVCVARIWCGLEVLRMHSELVRVY